MQKIVRTGLRNLSTAQIQHVHAVKYRAAEGQTAEVYREIERDFGILAPPIILHAPAPDVMAAIWLVLRETLLVPGSAPRAHKEAVSTAVSLGNECPFCITIHSSMVDNLVGFRGDVIADDGARAAADWATANQSPDTGADHPVPFVPEQAPELVGTAVVLQYLNRMVNIFLGEAPMPPFAPPFMLNVVRPVLTWLIKSAEQRGPEPGISAGLLPPAELPEDFAWAAGNPAIAEAFARGVAVVEAAGRRSVPRQVRDLVLAELEVWDGRSRGLSRAWVEEAVTGLPAGQRATGRLALLAAFASYQVDEGVVEGFRAEDADDRALIDVAAWASLSAARRIGTWMRTGSELAGDSFPATQQSV
jgi:hypothetical protein